MRIEGDTIEELFKAGVLGMADILIRDFCKSNNTFEGKTAIKLQAMDATCLLIDFLSEILSLSYAHKRVYCKVHFTKLTTTQAMADIYGKGTTHIEEEIKAVTYHEAQITKNSRNKWETFIIFDI